jgi:hypothetical protein
VRRPAATALALACILSLAAAGPAGAGRRTVPKGFFAVNYDRQVQYGPSNVQSKMWSRMATSGVESARVIFDWRTAQPLKDQPTSFAETDRVVAYAAAHGVRLLPVVMIAPPWARVIEDKESSAPSDVPAYAAYVAALVERYGKGGSFWEERGDLPRLPVRAWQIWNEPDLAYQWQPRDQWQARYGELLRAAATAVRQHDSGAKVVMAALTNDSWVALDQLYAQGGIAGNFDAVALNTYTRVPSHALEIVRRGRDVMNRQGDHDIPIWVTEFGASASKGRIEAPGNEHLQTTETKLAHLLKRVYGLFADNRRKVGIGRAYWYTWASSYDEARGAIFDFSGLLRYGAGRIDDKPVMRAYRTSARAREGCTKNARGACRKT